MMRSTIEGFIQILKCFLL